MSILCDIVANQLSEKKKKPSENQKTTGTASLGKK